MSDKIEIADDWARNDTTYYEHHQPRRWDGATPDSQGGSIWLTPKEIARGMLRLLGAPEPNAMADLRAQIEAEERNDA